MKLPDGQQDTEDAVGRLTNAQKRREPSLLPYRTLEPGVTERRFQVKPCKESPKNELTTEIGRNATTQ